MISTPPPEVNSVSEPSSFCFLARTKEIHSHSTHHPKHPLLFEQSSAQLKWKTIPSATPPPQFAFDYSAKSAPATSSWINGSTAALQSGDTDVTLNYLWDGVYRNHVLFHLCPAEAKPLIQGGELLGEGHRRDASNLHFSEITGGKLRVGADKTRTPETSEWRV